MEVEDRGRYNNLEGVLHAINRDHVALPEEQRQRNNKLLQVIDQILQRMRSNNTLFDSLYQNKFYGGSYYDKLRVGKPNEYDLDCILRLPKVAKAKVVASDKPGYMHVRLDGLEELRRKVDEAPKFVGLEKLLEADNFFSTKKMIAWMESLLSTATKAQKSSHQLQVHKSGPALTLTFTDEEGLKVDVDVVPCFTFNKDQWPQGNYRPNPFKQPDTFFVVPKSPTPEDVLYWRLSFQEQERLLINGQMLMKPVIKLIKKIRDRHQHKIASYYIKTVFLWEVERRDESFWRNSLSYLFVTMLKKYAEYLSEKCIPYYWNKDNNLIGNLSDAVTSNISDRMKNIIANIERTHQTDPYSVLQFILTSNEYDLETFKDEVKLSKKVQRKIEYCQKNLVMTTVQEPQLSTASSSSSFEDIIKEEAAETFSTNLEAVLAEQRKISLLLLTTVDKLDRVEAKVDKMREIMEARFAEEAVERNELREMINMYNKQVEDMKKKKQDDDEFVLDGISFRTDTLERTAELLFK